MSVSEKTVETTYLNAEDNVFTNFAGTDDVVVGLAGNDKIVGGGGDDLIIGGAGNDLLIGGAGNDIIRSGFGDDVLKGGAGDDIVLGLYGDNKLLGNDGDDILVAGSGTNFLVGGEGSDLFIFTDSFGGHGDAKIADFEIGVDTLRINSSTVTEFADLSIDYDAAGNAVFTDGADLTVKLIGITEADINTYGADLFII